MTLEEEDALVLYRLDAKPSSDVQSASDQTERMARRILERQRAEIRAKRTGTHSPASSGPSA